MKSLDLVILCGGKGSRLKNLTKNTPKPLLLTGKRSFLRNLLNFYIKYNFQNIYFLAGFKGDKIYKLYHNKVFNCIKTKVEIEKKPLGTGGSLYYLKKKIKNDFIVINGDSYLDYDFSEFLKFKKKKNKIILIQNKNYKSNTKLSNLNLDKKNKSIILDNKSKFMNAGVYYFKKNILNFVEKKKMSLENDIIPKLIQKKILFGFVSKNYFIDIGIKQNLSYARKTLEKFLNKPALFLDRDGVINKDLGYVHKYSQFFWNKKIFKIIKYYINKNYLIFIVSNQSGIARGYFKIKDFWKLHDKIKIFLQSRDIYIDEVVFCPHHVDGKIKKYSTRCKCRKPKIGMINYLKRNWSININKSLMIGDQFSDYLFAKKAGLKFVYSQKILRSKVKI